MVTCDVILSRGDNDMQVRHVGAVFARIRVDRRDVDVKRCVIFGNGCPNELYLLLLFRRKVEWIAVGIPLRNSEVIPTTDSVPVAYCFRLHMAVEVEE